MVMSFAVTHVMTQRSLPSGLTRVSRLCRVEFSGASPITAILPALRVKTIPGAKMRQGYKIGFDKLNNAQLNRMHDELKRNRSMGVIGDAPLNSTLHSLLTLVKPDGSERWVITCVTANDIDITIDFWWDQPDNHTSQQQRLHGAKYFWLTDMLKGYWQIRLHDDSQ